ncbi:MAG: DNA-3-methyladenine glycosylase 2 family protein [Alphaproteobacteria bacterium]|nr:DNA-3-methyladenine glycosylase 2 family protein [Alphaproteobacteria bacterium]
MIAPKSDRAFLSGLRRIAAEDVDIGRAFATHGRPPIRRIDPGYGALLRIMVGQQVSTQSAAAIWKRTTDRLGLAPTPGALLAASDEDLRSFGFSGSKIVYSRALALEIAEGRLDLDQVHRSPDDEALAMLTSMKGIGPWTAQVYLLFALGRADAFPAADIALMIAYQRIKGTKTRPDPKRMAAVAEAWSPWRGSVAHLLWHVYKQPL